MNTSHLLRSFAKYVGLNIIGMLAMSCYILADTFFVANAIGPNGLTALNFCISIFSILQGVGLMLGIGGATKYILVKEDKGQQESNLIFTHTVFLGSMVSVVFVIIGVFFSTPILTLLGADTVILPLAKIYLSTLLCFAPCFLLNNIFIVFVRNDQQPRLAMTAMIISSFSNIFLDYVFMFPLTMGMFGAAFATGLSPVISMLVLSIHLIKKRNGFHLYRGRFNVKKVTSICSLGLSSMIGELSSAIALITFNLVILRIEGNRGVAAYGIVANIALVATAIFTGIAQGLQPLSSKSYSNSNEKEGKQLYCYACITSIGLAMVLYIVLFFTKMEIASIFNRYNDVMLSNLAGEGIGIYFVGFFFAGINIVTAAFLSSSNRPKAAFLISIMRSFFILIPLIVGMGFLLGMAGVWIAFVLTELIVCVIAVIYGHK